MNPLELERLEDRFVLSSFVYSPQEVYLVELVNRARANPQAEQALYEQFVLDNGNLFEGKPLDLTAELPSDADVNRLGPTEPLGTRPTVRHSCTRGLRLSIWPAVTSPCTPSTGVSPWCSTGRSTTTVPCVASSSSAARTLLHIPIVRS